MITNSVLFICLQVCTISSASSVSCSSSINTRKRNLFPRHLCVAFPAASGLGYMSVVSAVVF